MKKLTLIRHAEAANPTLNEQDFDRRLTAHGQHQADQMANLLAQQGFSFDQLFTSTALRALSTAHAIYQATAFNTALTTPPNPITTHRQLYNIDFEPLCRFIECIDNDINHAVIVGHNPALSQLTNDLLPQSIPAMEPCTVAQLELSINDWVDLKTGCAQLKSYLTSS